MWACHLSCCKGSRFIDPMGSSEDSSIESPPTTRPHPWPKLLPKSAVNIISCLILVCMHEIADYIFSPLYLWQHWFHCLSLRDSSQLEHVCWRHFLLLPVGLLEQQLCQYGLLRCWSETVTLLQCFENLTLKCLCSYSLIPIPSPQCHKFKLHVIVRLQRHNI